MILTFEDKMSGIRCNLPEWALSGFQSTFQSFKWSDVPAFVQNGTWFQLNGLDVEILKKGDNSFDMRPMKYVGNAKGEITNTRISQDMLENAYCSLSIDDQIKVFFYNHDKDLWNELLEKFGSEENVYNYYIRFNH